MADRLVLHIGAMKSGTSFLQNVMAANADLLNWKENILLRYYTAETLQLERAKKTFLLPDRLMR